MTRRLRLAQRIVRADAGFTIIEMLIATLIMTAVTGAVFTLMNPSQGMFKAQPEVSDVQQRLRVGVDTLTKDLLMAGAGTYTGSSAGALYNFFAPVMPYRTGDVDADPAKGVRWRPDAISIMYVPATPSQTTIRDDMPKNSSQLKVEAQANCPPSKHDQLCGFEAGMRVLIFDQSGAWDAITITSVQDEALHLGYDGELSVAYKKGANITQVATHTYYLKTDTSTKTYQLMHYDGYQTDLPVVDHVVKLEFEYYGEPLPPAILPGKSLTDPQAPWTTYGPKPPALGQDNANDTWGKGENCTFLVDPATGQHAPRLATLGAGGVGLIKLDPAIFKDEHPMCPDSGKPEAFDADLLRIRRVRVNMRVQVAQDYLRGPAGVLFKYGGTSQGGERFVPDQEIRFDISPRNMNLGR